MDVFHNRLASVLGEGQQSVAWSPVVDIEAEMDYVIRAELPGLKGQG